MQFKTKTIIAACTLLMGTHAFAADAPLDGAALYKSKMCFTCHGPDGASPTAPMYPKLTTGSSEDMVNYMVAQTIAIRDGKRTNGATAAMKALTAAVTDEEFAAISKWLGDKPAIVAGGVDTTAAGAKLFGEKGCAACHGTDANTPVKSEENGNPPLLAGQGKTYTLNQMKDIRDGKRTNGDSAKMQAKIKDVTDADLATLAAWLESVKPAAE